jgi:hypothetical protein
MMSNNSKSKREAILATPSHLASSPCQHGQRTQPVAGARRSRTCVKTNHLGQLQVETLWCGKHYSVALNRPAPDPVPDIAADLLIAEHLLQEARG